MSWDAYWDREGNPPELSETEPAEVSARLIDRDGRILSLEGLDYVGECIVDLERRLAENDALLDAAIERAKRRAEALAAPLQGELERRKGQVAAYLQQHRHEVIPKGRRTRELPSGLVVGFRRKPAGYKWDTSMSPNGAEGALLDWATELQEGPLAPQPPLVEEQPRPNLKSIVRFLEARDAAGGAGAHEPPPGLRYVPEGVEEMVINVKEKKP